MKENQTNQKGCAAQQCNTDYINQLGGAPMYTIFLMQGSGKVSVDLVKYSFEGKIALFATPYQIVRFNAEQPLQT